MKRRFAARLGICVLGATMIAGSGVASAEEYDLGDASGKGPNIQFLDQGYQTNYETNVVQGQENIPFRFDLGFPSTLAELLNPPLACELWAAQYYSPLFEEAVLSTTGLYYNRSLARSRNPEDGGKGVAGSPQRTPYTETGPGTDEFGPRAVSDCPNRAQGRAFARTNGVTMDGFQIAGGWSETIAKVDPAAKVATGLQTVDLFDVRPNEALSIQSMHSVLETTHVAGKEPTFKFVLELQGVKAGGQEIIGFGANGFKVGGQGPGPEAVKQFNEGAAAYEKQFEAAFTYGFKIVEPRFFVDAAFDKFNFESPVVEGSISFPSRKGTVGDFQALRFGANNYRGVYKLVTKDEEGPGITCGGAREDAQCKTDQGNKVG